MKNQIDTKGLLPLAEFITSFYGGDQEQLSQDLNKAIYLLHYVPKEKATEDVENVCLVLHQISKSLIS